MERVGNICEMRHTGAPVFPPLTQEALSSRCGEFLLTTTFTVERDDVQAPERNRSGGRRSRRRSWSPAPPDSFTGILHNYTAQNRLYISHELSTTLSKSFFKVLDMSCIMDLD